MRIDLFRSGLILLGIFCSISAARGQSSIHGVIADERDKPLQNANILLLRYSDSTLVKGTVSTSAGFYLFENVKNGKYLLSASHIGMDRVYGPNGFYWFYWKHRKYRINRVHGLNWKYWFHRCNRYSWSSKCNCW